MGRRSPGKAFGEPTRPPGRAERARPQAAQGARPAHRAV